MIPSRRASGHSGILLAFLIAIVIPGPLPVGSQSAFAQKSQPTGAARTLIAIKATGSKRFPQEAIASASGLQIGTSYGDDDFKKAARRLGDTGAFTDIAYTFSYSSEGTKLEFQVTDAAQFVPARFEDFVWFSDEEILHRLKEHIPLFGGELPVTGNMPQEVSDVLQAMLVEKGIPGNVTAERIHRPDPNVEGGPVEAVAYTVSEVLIRVHGVQFAGASADELPRLESAARRLEGVEYSRDSFNTLVQRELLPVYHARGYLKASFGPPQPRVVRPDADADVPRNLTLVDVTLAVTPGLQYKLGHIEWTGNREIPTATLESMVPAKTGEPADTVQLGDELAAVRTLYGSRGHITASIKPEAQFDDTAPTVTIRLNVNEGPAFHMGDIEFRGIDNSLTAKLRNAWKIRSGEIFDATYLKQYLPQARKLLPATLDWDIAPHVTANVREKTVDVDFQLTAKAPK